MVVVGGYVGTTIPCDSPGIYVFNTSSLEWADSFTSLSPKPDLHPENSVLAASYGYTVPDQVVSVIGGSPEGSATVTKPAVTATEGPFATGKSPVFTITASGSTATITSPGSVTTNNAGSSPSSAGVTPGLIAAIVIAAIAGLAAGYLGYCAWLYRRQVRAYKTHLAVANRYSAPAPSASRHSLAGLAGLFGMGGRRGSQQRESSQTSTTAAAATPLSKRLTLQQRLAEKGGWGGGKQLRDESATSGEESFAWVGRGSLEPKTSAEPTPSGSGTSPFTPAGSSGRARRGSDSNGSVVSTDGLLDGQELSFFSVVMAPRRALRVVNNIEDGDGH